MIEPIPLENHPADSRVKISADGKCQALTSRMGTGGGKAVCVDMGGGKSSCSILEEQSPTLATTHYGEPAVAYAINHQGGGEEVITNEITGTLTAAMNSSGNNKLSVVCAAGFCPEEGGKTLGIGYKEEQAPTLRSPATPAIVVLDEPPITYCSELGAATRVGGCIYEEMSGTIRAKMGDNLPAVFVPTMTRRTDE